MLVDLTKLEAPLMHIMYKSQRELHLLRCQTMAKYPPEITVREIQRDEEGEKVVEKYDPVLLLVIRSLKLTTGLKWKALRRSARGRF